MGVGSVECFCGVVVRVIVWVLVYCMGIGRDGGECGRIPIGCCSRLYGMFGFTILIAFFLFF